MTTTRSAIIALQSCLELWTISSFDQDDRHETGQPKVRLICIGHVSRKNDHQHASHQRPTWSTLNSFQRGRFSVSKDVHSSVFQDNIAHSDESKAHERSSWNRVEPYSRYLIFLPYLDVILGSLRSLVNGRLSGPAFSTLPNQLV